MSTRRIRLGVFSVAIVLGILFLMKTLHYGDDFLIPSLDTNIAKVNNILVSDEETSNKKSSKEKSTDSKKVLNDPAAASQVTDNSNNIEDKESSSTKIGTQKDLTEKPGEEFKPEKEFNEILSFSPVVIFSKTQCPYSQRLKTLLKNEYELIPEPIIVELDKHKHGKELQNYIGEKSGRRTVPNLFVKGKSRGGSDDIRELHDKGELLDLLTTWGGKALKVTKHSVPSNS